MAHTDKTRPWWVKIQETLVEVHDHRNGVCEIAGARPSRPTVGWRRGGRCYFDGCWWDPQLWCGCGLCRGDWGERRQARREGKRQAREWWKE